MVSQSLSSSSPTTILSLLLASSCVYVGTVFVSAPAHSCRLVQVTGHSLSLSLSLCRRLLFALFLRQYWLSCETSQGRIIVSQHPSRLFPLLLDDHLLLISFFLSFSPSGWKRIYWFSSTVVCHIIFSLPLFDRQCVSRVKNGDW